MRPVWPGRFGARGADRRVHLGWQSGYSAGDSVRAVLGVICDGGRRFRVDAPLVAGALVRLGVTGGMSCRWAARTSALFGKAQAEAGADRAA
jgi:hypothetical protein